MTRPSAGLRYGHLEADGQQRSHAGQGRVTVGRAKVEAQVECRTSGASPLNRMLLVAVAAALATVVSLIPQSTVWADAPTATVAYQPMVSAGLAVRQPFEAWFVLDKSLDPAVPGYEVLAGATIRFTFPEQFTPSPGGPMDVVMLYGWPQRAIPVAVTVAQDKGQPRAITICFDQTIPAGPREKPGLKGDPSAGQPAQSGLAGRLSDRDRVRQCRRAHRDDPGDRAYH